MSWKYPAKRVLVDFDGTLGPFYWPGVPPKPYPGAVEALRKLKSLGYEIVVFTTRVWEGWAEIDGPEKYRQQIDDMKSWLARYDVPCDFITCEKIPALAIIDDRSLNPKQIGWERVVEEVTNPGDLYGQLREGKEMSRWWIRGATTSGTGTTSTT